MVQAAREWWKKFIRTLKVKIGFKQFQVDHCLLMKKDKAAFVAIGIHVDDCLMIGDEKAVNKFVSDVKEFFDITTEEANGFAGCSIEKRGDAVYLHQPDLIKKMVKTFEKEISGMKKYSTQASAGYRVTKPRVGKYQEPNASYQQMRRRVAATRSPVSY